MINVNAIDYHEIINVFFCLIPWLQVPIWIRPWPPCSLLSCCLFPNDFESAVLHAVNSGGQNQARAILTGALVGAQIGFSCIPKRFLDGLEDLGKLKNHAIAIASQVNGDTYTID